LRYPQTLAGIMGLSTYLLFPERLDSECHAANADTPLFIAHGNMDPVVPFGMGEDTAQRLEANGYTVTWNSYPIPHSVSPEEIAHIGAWLRDCLG
jgi:phospholipase/carboxylesterase